MTSVVSGRESLSVVNSVPTIPSVIGNVKVEREDKRRKVDDDDADDDDGNDDDDDDNDDGDDDVDNGDDDDGDVGDVVGDGLDVSRFISVIVGLSITSNPSVVREFSVK